MELKHSLGTLRKDSHVSLAEKMRPKDLHSYIGQNQIISCGSILNNLINNGEIPSMILWGPPGCGKTSLANIIANLSKKILGDKVRYIKLSATGSGINNIKEIVVKAKEDCKLGRQTIVFIDEIHRFNKLQQDIFLPHVESGTFKLIGATTENPSFSCNSALLSRCRVFILNKLKPEDVETILCKTINSINGEIHTSNNTNKNFTSSKFVIDEELVKWMSEVCNGDARIALNTLELAVKMKLTNISNNQPVTITSDDLKKGLQNSHLMKEQETNEVQHLYSALHKSIAAGKENACLYWLARLMAAKEDPVYIARHLIRVCSKEVGLADPDALDIAIQTAHACQMIGMPECDVILGQCAIYLCRAPKSQVAYNALRTAQDVIANYKGPQPSVPQHIKDKSAEGKLISKYAKDTGNMIRKCDSSRNYLPAGLENTVFINEDCLI